jgi:gamma-glutamyltranspeptidase/glutathione hydrolase
VLPKTGILLQNRGISFALDSVALNALEPGRRPFHTLNPAMASFDDGRMMSYGAMGGDGQPQFQAQVFSRHAWFGESVAASLDAPRFLFGRTWGTSSTTLKLEDRFDASVVSDLNAAGHQVEIVPKPYADDFGHAGLLVREAAGRIAAGHDPRSDGGARGL